MPARLPRFPVRRVLAVLVALAVVAGWCAGAAAASTVDGQDAGGGKLGPGATVELSVLGRAGVPASGVAAVTVNVTVTDPSAATFLTVWPAGQARPDASNLNAAAGQTTANLAVVGVGVGGRVALFNAAGSVHVIVDVLGWYPAGGGYTPVGPQRLADTRAGGATGDRLGAGGGPVTAGETLDVEVAGRAGVPPSGVGAVVVNVTVTDPSMATFLTVWPAGQARPNASNLNAAAGQTTANLAVVGVGSGGRISVFNAAGGAQVIVDVLGWYPAGGGYTPVGPARLADTRAGGVTVDGLAAGGGPVAAGATLEVTVAGRAGVPGSASGAVALNVTVAGPSAATFLTVWPAGGPRPNASNLNVSPGQTTANLVVTGVGVDGRVAIFNAAGSAPVIVDVAGWYPSGGDYTAVGPARLLDTRPEPPAPGGTAIDRLVVAPESAPVPYDRARFKHWIDADRDGCDTRDEVLIAQSLRPVTIGRLCALSGGWWVSVYDGYSTGDPTELEIDHVVALAEAWSSGAWQWTDARREQFANDVAGLLAVTIATNRSKSDKDPAEWQPPNRASWCGFVRIWVTMKLTYGLTADPAEVAALRNLSVGCPA